MNHVHDQAEGLLFQLEHIAGLAGIRQLDRYSHADADSTRMMLEQAADFAVDALQPLAASGDIEGCRLEDGRVLLPQGTAEVWRQWCELGFPALGMPQTHDGLDFPLAVQCAVQELCDGSNLAFGMLAINQRCAALALLQSAAPELVQRWLPSLVDGSITSTIVISEAQAGSDVGRIRTAAQPAADGCWKLNGSKLWISYADHDASRQILHLVLARVPNGEQGTRGLGLFAVPRLLDDTGAGTGGSDNGLAVLRLEHKMGLHASPTCVLELKDSTGWLIGEPGRGLQALFVMMNAMRLAVAVQGAAVANAATLQAVAYARERPQGGSPLQAPPAITEHADVRRMLLEMTARAELARALVLRTASFLDLAAATSGEEARHWQALGELLLPIAKTLNAECGFEVANQGIQVLGGYGYTRDYPLERLARDIRVAAIYEGTSGIQALDFLKRKVLGDEGATLASLCRLVREAASDASPYAEVLPRLLELLDQTLATIRNDKQRIESGAYALLQLAGQAVHAWNGHCLYQAAASDSDRDHRLRAALSHHAQSQLAVAESWAERALALLPAYRFPPR